MSFGPSRDRRGFGGKDAGVDMDALERDNEMGLGGLADRVGLMRQAAEGIRNQADSQHRLLDDMDSSMTNNRSTMSSAVDRFKLTMNDKHTRKMTTIVVGTIAALLLLWLLTRR